MKTFGEYFLNFVRSIDIVDNTIYQTALNTCEEYCKNHLKVEMSTLFVPEEVGIESPSIGLRGVSGWDYHPTTLMPPEVTNGKIDGQTMYSWVNRKPLWIRGEDEKPISDENTTYVESWSNTVHIDLPKYINKYKGPNNIFTSIIIPIPLNHKEQSKGIINFESSEIVFFSQETKLEFENIAEALYLLFVLKNNFKLQTKNSKIVLSNLPIESIKQAYELKYDVFLSYPDKSDVDVINVINKVLQKRQLRVFDWKKVYKTGSILDELNRAISSCRIGICYFSEDSGERKYKDNSNVIFEAGILEAKTRWLPIREELPPVFFDLEKIRITIVPRLQNNKLDSEQFYKNLNDRLDHILS